MYTATLGVAKPYIETQDNWLAILAECQLFFVFMSCPFLKYWQAAEDRYDSVGMGVLLVMLYVLLLLAFQAWTFFKEENMGASSRGKAIRTLKGKQSKDEDKDRFVDKQSVVVASDKDVGV